jgi:hypothetical protein
MGDSPTSLVPNIFLGRFKNFLSRYLAETFSRNVMLGSCGESGREMQKEHTGGFDPSCRAR